jgi:hypothetical protein
MNNFKRIKKMNMEELSVLNVIEIYTESNDGHITKKWLVGLDGGVYKNHEELKEKVVEWLKQPVTQEEANK